MYGDVSLDVAFDFRRAVAALLGSFVWQLNGCSNRRMTRGCLFSSDSVSESGSAVFQ